MFCLGSFILPDSRPDVLPYRLPTTDSGRQQLRAGWADPAGATSNAPSLPGGCGREPSPASIPAAGARQGGLQGWAAYPADGGHFLRYRGWTSERQLCSAAPCLCASDQRVAPISADQTALIVWQKCCLSSKERLLRKKHQRWQWEPNLCRQFKMLEEISTGWVVIEMYQ